LQLLPTSCWPISNVHKVERLIVNCLNIKNNLDVIFWLIARHVLCAILQTFKKQKFYFCKAGRSLFGRLRIEFLAKSTLAKIDTKKPVVNTSWVEKRSNHNMRQMGFSFIKNYKKEFGGSQLLGKRKTRRPLSTKAPIHLVLRASHHKIFAPGDKYLTALLHAECRKYKIKLYDFAFNWTHVHVLIKLPNREAYVKMIRSLTSKVVAHVSQIMGWDFSGLFSLRPFTKILSWGKQFQNALMYQAINKAEAQGGSRARRDLVAEQRGRSENR